MDVRSPLCQNIASVLIYVLLLNPIVSTAAELSLDASAASNASLGQAANGVPVVNIATPNGSGLSHNTFTDFNIGAQGLILNNATQSTQSTQLGGVILGNSNLQGKAAQLILNEVNGGSPSQLKGYTEVAGQSAHVVVANPHGITCDGCGFINTPRVTLSTGTPVIDGGHLQRFEVNGGVIRIDGAGVNASNVGQFDLITRSAQINAQLQAQQLNVIAGRNAVDASTLRVTAKADDGSDKPLLAIDSSALGGMYAGSIRLVGTEQGVGVNLAGDLISSAGDMQLDVNGQLSLSRTSSAGDLRVQAGSVDLLDDVDSAGKTQLQARDQVYLQQDKRLSAGGDLTLGADEIDNQGSMASGSLPEGGKNAASQLNIDADALYNSGQVVAHGAAEIKADYLDNQQGVVLAEGDLNLATGELDNRYGQIIGQQKLRLQGASLDNRNGTLASNQALEADLSGTLDNSDDGLLFSKAGGLQVTAEHLKNAGGILQADQGALHISASSLDNQAGSVQARAGALELQAQTIDNRQGSLIAHGGALSTQGQQLDNRTGYVQGDSLSLRSSTELNNQQGQVLAIVTDAQLHSATLLNQSGQIRAERTVQLSGSALHNQNAELGAQRIELSLSGELDNTDGLIESSSELHVQALSLGNENGRLRAFGSRGESRFDVGQLLDNSEGQIEIGNDRFSLQAAGLDNSSGQLLHLGQAGFALQLADIEGLGDGEVISNSDLTLTASRWVGRGLLQAANVTLNIDELTLDHGARVIGVNSLNGTGGTWFNDGLLASDGDLELSLSGDYGGFGDIYSLHDMQLSAANLSVDEGARIQGGGRVNLTLSGTLSGYGGQFTAQGPLVIQAAEIENQYSAIGSAGSLHISTQNLFNQGLLFSGADMQLFSNSLTNHYGDIYSLGSLLMARNASGEQVGRLENLSGSIESAGNMELHAAVLDNRKERFELGREQTYGHISVRCYDCGGDHHNVDYIATERFELAVSEDSTSSQIHSGGELSITGGAINNHYSRVSAGGNLSIVADTLDNRGAANGVFERVRTFNTGRVTDGTDERTRANHIYPYNAAAFPKVLPGGVTLFNQVSDIETFTPDGSLLAPAVIQAGGSISIQASQSLSNGTLNAFTASQGGADQQLDTDVSANQQTLQVRLNPQLPADLDQQMVNPLSLPGFSLPERGLFQLNLNPDHPYLVETNPAFASLNHFLNSDYLLSRLGFSADDMQRRLGDGLYEQRLIQQAILARTGQRFLAGLTTDEAMFQYLMDNAIASQQALQLSVGVALTAEQVAALTHDIVWLQEQEVKGQKVLVPVLYLAQSNDRLAPSGALIQGQDLALISGSSLNNSGTLRASQNLSASANRISNTGLMQANERLSLLATDSIRNAQGGIIAGKDVSAIALTGDLRNERSITQQSMSGRGYSQLTSVVDSAAGIEAKGDLSLAAGRDFQNIGGTLKAGGDAALDAGRDVVIAAATEEQALMRKDRRHFWSNSTTTQHGSDVQVGGDLSVSAGNTLTVIGSTVKADGDIRLQAEADVALASAANQSSSEYRYNRSDKKIRKENSNISQQASVIEAGGDVAIASGNDLSITASQVSAAGNVALSAEQDVNILSAQDEAASFYAKSSKSSFGRSKSQQQESYNSSNVASMIEAGQDLTINSSATASGGMSIDGGRDVNVIGSELNAGGDLLVGAMGDVAILSGIEEHGAYSKKSKSGLLGLSSSGKSQLKTKASQVSSELTAGNDVLIASGHDIRLRASQTTAGNDVELHAGLVDQAGDINLVSANDTSYSLTKSYENKVGLSSSSNFISFASAKSAGQQAQSSTSVASQVRGGQDATLLAARDITLVGSGVSAGRTVTLGAGRDVNLLAASNSNAQSQWEKNKQLGIGWGSDENAVNVFVGAERTHDTASQLSETAAPSQLNAGQDVVVEAGRDLNQRGSDIQAERDIRLTAGRAISIDAATERQASQQAHVTERQGLTANVSHNYGNTKNAVNNAGAGDNALSQGSSSLRAVDSVSQFFSGPSAGAHLGNTQQSDSQSTEQLTSRGSTLQAGRDIQAQAATDLTINGSQLTAGRDISLAGSNVSLGVAQNQSRNDSQQNISQAGLNGQAGQGSARAGIGGSRGVAEQNQASSTAQVTELQAGRDVALQAEQDLTLTGTQVQAGRNIDLAAGQNLTIQSAQNSFTSEDSRNSLGGEVGLVVGGQEGIGVYASVNIGKGQLERDGEQQKAAYLYAGNQLNFSSGEDTRIVGATLQGNDVTGRVGGDLLVASAVDTGKVKGKEFDLSVTVTVGPSGGSVSGSAGYGRTTGSTNWVDAQTSIIAADKLDIRTQNHTQIDGALIASDSGNLKLDTDTLGFSDIHGTDKEHGYYASVGGSYGFGGSDAVQDNSQKGKGEPGQNNWSVSGYDYRKDREQIVRATVGAGEIVVRSDAGTGNDATAGLNRDEDQAYVITKDEEERTDVYASSSSLEAASHPQVTLEQWKQGAENYGLNAALVFDKFIQLQKQAEKSAERDELIAALAWAPSLLIDAMNKAGTFTGGAFPSPESYGGVITQIPVLVTGDLMAKKVIASFLRDSQGRVVVDESGKPILDEKSMQIEEFSKLKNDDNIFTNGILNGLMEAITNGVMQSDSDGVDFVMAYNPTHGLFGDLLESGFDSLLNGTVQSGTARNLSSIFQQGIADNVETVHIYGHSQGGLLTWVAVKDLDFTNGGTQVQMGSIQLSGAPVDAVDFGKGAEKIGFEGRDQHAFQVNRPDERVFFDLLPKTDSVADMPLLGGNAQYSSDPVALTLGSIFSLVSVLGFGESPHSNYACVTCETPASGSAAAQIRDIVTKPTLIDQH